MICWFAGFYRLLYRTAPKEQTLKAELRQFSGFAYGEDTAAERAKDEMKLNDWLSDSLGELGELLDLHAPRSGTKQSKIEKILDFLATPGAREGATSLREKKEKEGAKKKRKAERAAKAKGSKKAKVGLCPKCAYMPCRSRALLDWTADAAVRRAATLSIPSYYKAAPKKKRAKKVAADEEEEEEEENDDEGPSDKELRKEIEAYLNTADLTKVTMKIVRAHLADKFGDLSTRREDIKRLVVEVRDTCKRRACAVNSCQALPELTNTTPYPYTPTLQVQTEMEEDNKPLRG